MIHALKGTISCTVKGVTWCSPSFSLRSQQKPRIHRSKNSRILRISTTPTPRNSHPHFSWHPSNHAFNKKFIPKPKPPPGATSTPPPPAAAAVAAAPSPTVAARARVAARCRSGDGCPARRISTGEAGGRVVVRQLPQGNCWCKVFYLTEVMEGRETERL